MAVSVVTAIHNGSGTPATTDVYEPANFFSVSESGYLQLKTHPAGSVVAAYGPKMWMWAYADDTYKTK